MPLTSTSDDHARRGPAPGPPAFPGTGATETVPVRGRAERGSADAEFTAFMTEHRRDLLRTAWLLVGDEHRAEELTQQALVRTYTSWSRARRDPLAYARRVLVNLRVDTWRRRRREVLVAPAEVPDTPVAASRRAEDRDQLLRALAVLTPRQRRIVVLRHLLDLSDTEVADDLGVSPGTVRSTASRGLAVLRAAMTAGTEHRPPRVPHPHAPTWTETPR